MPPRGFLDRLRAKRQAAADAARAPTEPQGAAGAPSFPPGLPRRPLSELDPHWVVEESTQKAGFTCRCPCGVCDEDRRLYVPLKNPLGPGPVAWRERGWLRIGEDFGALTLIPSIRRLEGCRWHGVLEAGVFVTVS